VIGCVAGAVICCCILLFFCLPACRGKKNYADSSDSNLANTSKQYGELHHEGDAEHTGTGDTADQSVEMADVGETHTAE